MGSLLVISEGLAGRVDKDRRTREGANNLDESSQSLRPEPLHRPPRAQQGDPWHSHAPCAHTPSLPDALRPSNCFPVWSNLPHHAHTQFPFVQRYVL